MKRFGVSIPEDLLQRFDEAVMKRNYSGRSEAIRDAIRLFLTQAEWEENQEGNYASLNIVYQHKPKLMEELIEKQHNAKVNVLSSVHIHLTHSHCFELLTIKGTNEGISELADEIAGIPGIEYSQLFTFMLPEGDANHAH
ncbi:nickel-responsive transcriptional regulator NikR [Candidatus Thorarchaeota archaeon]|nr:MAG: nickel-responsive transcriptional regulator NikR [Candidatus Thorarchaeota archaeon]